MIFLLIGSENFIKDPQQLINSKDEHAVQLHEKYKTTCLPFLG
jgi:hypothetical protein